MIDIKENELINIKLDTLYKKFTPDFLDEWKKAFEENAPYRLNEFGIIDIHRYDKDSGILFICRETNGWKNEDFSSGCLFRSWMCNITENGLSGKSHIKRHPNMWYNIGRWTILINSPETSVDDIASLKCEALKAIGKIAFTNINKVRGKEESRKEYDRLSKSAVAGEVLRQEIEIIKPKMVVCCGTERVFRHHVKNYSGKVIYMPHPGARLNTKDMLLELKKQI